MVNWKKDWKALTLIVSGFLVFLYLPVEALQRSGRLGDAVWESLHLVRWYAREHVVLCLVPALFIAGAIAVFVSQVKGCYLGNRLGNAVWKT